MSSRKILWIIMMSVAVSLFGASCRYDMQDQPRYKQFKKSDFFKDHKAMRELPEGTVPRGFLRENKAFFQGKKENVDAGAQPTTGMDSKGNSVVTSFPDVIEKNPVPITADLVARGEQRYKVFCIVCHGPVGNGDGMIVRRGYPQPPSYNDDRLRNAPDGHFFDVITNGWGKMNSYGSQIPPEDRWAIVAYIRALEISQNPNGNAQMTGNQTNQTQDPTIQSRGNNAAVPQTGSNGGRNR